MKNLKFLVFTLVILFVGLINVNAASVEVDTEDELRAALESGQSVVLTDDIELTNETEVEVAKKDDRPTAIAINGEGAITIDGNGHTISTSSVRTIFEIYATGSEKLEVTLNDVVLNNTIAGGRCIDTRTSSIVLNINDSELATTRGTYDQALTIGGTYTTPIKVNLKNTEIASKYYAIVAFNPIDLTIDGGSSVGGYAAIYMKDNSANSVVKINDVEIIGANVSTAPVCAEDEPLNKCNPYTNDFGAIVLEDTGIEIEANNNSIITSTEASTATEYVILDKTSSDTEGNTITIKNSIVNAASEVVKLYNANTKIIVGDKTVTNFDVPKAFLATEAKVVNTGDNEYTVYEPHTITIKDSANGKVVANTSKAYFGDEITLTITPDKGYELSTIGYAFVNENSGEDLAGRATFNMADKDIVITATFEKIKYNVLNHAGENGTLKFDKELATSGETVTMTITPDEGYEILSIKIIDKDNKVIEVKDNKFTMPESDVWVSVEFAKEVITEMPVINTTEEVKEVTVGVKEESQIKDVLLDSLAANKDLVEKVKDTDVKVVVDVYGVDVERLDEKVKSAIEEKAGKGTIAEYFDITIALKETKTDKEIATISELTEEIELTILLPENLKNTNKEFNRNYFVIREHEGVVSTIQAKLSEDGKYLTFKSKDFSTYALVYEDTKIENPKTGDNVIFYAIAGIVSICGLGFIVKTKKFN